MTDRIIKLISTIFYLGYLPIPGTVGSFAALLIYFLIRINNSVYLIVLSVFLILGFLFCGKAEKVFNQKDSRKIIIDEVCGMLLALFLLPAKLPIIVIAFFLFRALDTIKPPPINKLQELPGSLGIMIDDILAGIYTNLMIQLALRLTSTIAS